jgi:hypothetical protein
MRDLRIGYVNVRGLSKASWQACLSLLNSSVDYLFMAETWFVRHEIYLQDRRFIASTKAAPKNLRGRSKGGVYLLGSHHMRSKISHIETTEFSITFHQGQLACTGVYFPPTTLAIDEMSKLLNSFKQSAIILGDINTRFRDPEVQAGQPGPPNRIRLFQQMTNYQHLKPLPGAMQLTTDHCFVQKRYVAKIQLLDNTKLKMDTDHKYTLALLLEGTERVPKVTRDKIYRFRIGQLQRYKDEMIAMVAKTKRPFRKGDDVDGMHAALVQCCQQIQQRTIGEAGKISSSWANQKKAGPVRATTAVEPTLEGSIRLYKQASQTSDENDIIFPTMEAQQQGIDAMAENLVIYKQRWQSQGECIPRLRPPSKDYQERWTLEMLIAEITQQEAEKSCGADGIHIRFLKMVQNTRIMDWLLELYNTCLASGVTPRMWNRSEIYLLAKDPSKRRDARNIRPISIICIFRKVFERLLLLTAQGQPWAHLHPGQAGFRRSYSTLTNAAIVHTLLASKQRRTAVFLDLKSAFDVVDFGKLDAKLAKRGCPALIRSLIHNLMFHHLESRILINQEMTEWFSRTQGVLQGSPLSPWLFNLFIDDLLEMVNPLSPKLPDCVFYADDGVLITEDSLPEKLQLVEYWTKQNGILLNPTKCAVVSSNPNLLPLRVYDQEIPQVETYLYLGFPVTSDGIDFLQYLSQRVKVAQGRAHWLRPHSGGWGPAHRLRVYKQYLAPMFEYGAPLVWAWAKDNLDLFDKATIGFKDLMSWISDTQDSRYRITANLCGLTMLQMRFQLLHTKYQWIIEQMNPSNPLKQLLAQPHPLLFLHSLQNDALFKQFKVGDKHGPTIPEALCYFLRDQHKQQIQRDSQKSHLTSLIPMNSRQVPGLFLGDISLKAPVQYQKLLFAYRRGVFMFKSICICNAKFHRGHEVCFTSIALHLLSHTDRAKKRAMWLDLSLDCLEFTNLDFFINSMQLKRAGTILLQVREELGQIYKKVQEEEKQNSNVIITN